MTKTRGWMWNTELLFVESYTKIVCFSVRGPRLWFKGLVKQLNVFVLLLEWTLTISPEKLTCQGTKIGLLLVWRRRCANVPGLVQSLVRRRWRAEVEESSSSLSEDFSVLRCRNRCSCFVVSRGAGEFY